MSTFSLRIRHVKVSDLKIKDYLEVDFCGVNQEDFLRAADSFLEKARREGLSQVRLKIPFGDVEFEAALVDAGYKPGLIFVERESAIQSVDLDEIKNVRVLKDVLLKQQILHYEFDNDFFEEPSKFDLDGYLGELQDGVVYGIYEVDELIAFVAVEVSGADVYINELFVDDGYRGKGLGKSLVDAVCGYAASIGARKVWTTLAVGNEAALRFYRKSGFEPTSKLFYLNDF